MGLLYRRRNEGGRLDMWVLMGAKERGEWAWVGEVAGAGGEAR